MCVCVWEGGGGGGLGQVEGQAESGRKGRGLKGYLTVHFGNGHNM